MATKAAASLATIPCDALPSPLTSTSRKSRQADGKAGLDRVILAFRGNIALAKAGRHEKGASRLLFASCAVLAPDGRSAIQVAHAQANAALAIHLEYLDPDLIAFG